MPEPLQDADAPEVLKERCEYIYRRILPAVGATAVLSLLLSAFLWPSSPTELIVFWQTAILLIAAGYWALALAYQRSGDSREHPQPWIRRAAFGAAALGAAWGFATAVFFPGGDYQQVFIAFVVALVTAGGLPMFSTVWWIYALYAAGVMIPFNGVLFAYGTDFFHLLGAAVPLLYIANVATAYQLGKAFSSAYGLRSAYERLSADNAATQAQLGEQLDSLLEAHREVQAFGRKLALFSERAPIAVFEVDPHATILDMNPAAENLFGYAAPEMLGRSCISMLLNPDDRESTDKWWDELVAQGRPATVVAERCLRRDGLELACEWTMTPLVDDDNRVISVILQGRDITQQRAAQRMLDLINEVLDIEKIESGQLTLVPEPMPLDALLGESLRLNQGYADRFRANLALHGEVPQVVVRADRKRLMQVMTNLLSNAAKFSPPNSAVDVTVAQKEAVVRVEVSDRGPGIPEAFRGRIFGRFAQADSADSRVKGGTGLGLAICKRLVEMMQGRIGFEDREGGGTTFFFELPVMPPEESTAEAAPRVLLTEHDTVAAEYLSMVLEKGGYRVDAAPDASASRELLGRWKYAVWLLARRLRDGEDPLALIAEVKPRLGGTPIIMLASTRSDAAYVSEPQRVGVVDWLLKSDSRTRILDAVAHALGRA